MNFSSRLLPVLVLVGLPWSAVAGVYVSQNLSPGATVWPGTPLISTMANPAGQATVAESFNGGGGNTNLSQTFTIAGTDYTLLTISLYAGTGTGTGSGTNLILRLYDLGSQTAPNPSSYTGGADLFNSGSGLSIAYTSQAYGVLQFDFTGADQVTLQAGHMYAFTIAGAINTTPVFWQRATNDAYAGGAAYRNQAWINGNSARDFALAVYATANSTNPALSARSTVNWTSVRQRIDGFGGGVVFLNPGTLDPVTDAIMDTLYGTANASQLGLTLLRVRIAPDNTWANALLDGQKAVARGAKVLATPWTPPASMKDNGNTIDGSLLPAQYGNYALYLKGFAEYMATNGAPLAAISIQNEPDITVTYESCDWTAAQFQTFFRSNAAAIGSTPVMMPESFNFNPAISDATLNDPVAVTNVDLVGGHLYGVTTIPANTNALAHNKPVWMTEYLVNDQTIGTAIDTAKQIHDCLTLGNMSAYIWWKCLGDANGLVNASGVPQKRGFVMAQFSRFVRPDYYRIGTAYDPGSAVTAFKNPASGAFAIVAINTNSSTPINQTFNLTNFTAGSVTPWITSASQSLAVQTAVAVSNASFTYTLPPQSVVTFVGVVGAANTSPMLAAVPDRVLDAGVTLQITNAATDPDVPPQTLTFSLLSGPGNATLTTLNASNALFTWRPLVSQANTTSSISVKVADNGSPAASATNNFTVTVNSLGQASFGSIAVAGAEVTLAVTGPSGPDYTIWTSTNLLNWSAGFTTNSPTPPFTVADTNVNAASFFYRIQLGP
jgi:glucuronoarabinoxylan endo-1,4-beta-xylanase